LAATSLARLRAAQSASEITDRIALIIVLCEQWYSSRVNDVTVVSLARSRRTISTASAMTAVV